MALFLACLSALAVVNAIPAIFPSDEVTPAITDALVTFVNEKKSTWKAAVPSKFSNATIAQVKRMLGTVMIGEPNYVPVETVKTEFKTSAEAIPESFDARVAFSQCANIIGHVRDQSSCGSCWAFGSTEAFNDRYCIASGDATTLMSPEDTNACCSGLTCSFSMGCNGGQPSGAWNWFVKTGVSTGADYGNIGEGKTCKPYSLKSCAHHVTPPDGMVACDTLPSYSTPKCTSTCSESAYTKAYSNDKHKADSSYTVKTVANIQKELIESGPVTVAMTVYEDFEAYSSGVYQHVTGKSLGGHAIKLIGWGVDNGTPYWTLVNSWNESWGEKGTFRILRGSNECGIEADVVAGKVSA